METREIIKTDEQLEEEAKKNQGSGPPKTPTSNPGQTPQTPEPE